jgi:hypothetical protein
VAKQAGGKPFKPTAAWARGFHARFPELKRWRLEAEDGTWCVRACVAVCCL